jgi:hypothetical protein
MYINILAKKILMSLKIILLFFFASAINAQQLSQENLDSIYFKFLQLRAPELLPQTDRLQELTNEDRKCGFQIVTSIKSYIDLFSPEQQFVLQKILSRPSLQTSIVSPSGFFRIHYDQTGNNSPSYVSSLSADQNAVEVAVALDSVYRFEVNYLGYLSPPDDNNAGDDNKYDVYIQNQSAGLYGYTEPESKIGTTNWTSFIVIDNDYVGYYSSGIDGMLVTVAHEFHHAIQVGNYSVPDPNSPYRDSDVYFYELTSTAMEEFVYDTVNDYYAYMQSYFQNPQAAMSNQNGYNLAIWNIYLQEIFGFDLLKQQWELIPGTSAILSINNSILSAGSSFPGELNKFGIWTYYTNSRTIPGSYFEEAANYPLIRPTATLAFTPPQQTADMTSAPIANNFVKFNITSAGDTLYAIVTNGDAFAANQVFNYDYSLFSDTTSGARMLTNNYSSTFITSNPSYWSVSEILNGLLVRSDSVLIPIVEVNESFVFPNPFSYSSSGDGSDSNINIVLNMQSGTEVDFNVYSSGLELVYSTNNKLVGPLINNSLGIYWDGLDYNNNKVGSGVYIYVIKQGDEVVKGKVVIFNE